MRVLRSIARNQLSGTTYAPVGTAYMRAKGLVEYGLAIPTHDRAIAGFQTFAVTLAGRQLLASLDKLDTDNRQKRYWLREP